MENLSLCKCKVRTIGISVALICFLSHPPHRAEEELEAGERVIERNEHFMAFVPFAAICPFETWILPLKACAFDSFLLVTRNGLQHQAYFHMMSDEERDSFVAILHRWRPIERGSVIGPDLLAIKNDEKITYGPG
eukprot:746454-Hanusia_phi.AAC.1